MSHLTARLPSITVLLLATLLAAGAYAQDVQVLELRASGDTMPYTRPAPGDAPRATAATDSIWYDNGSGAPSSFLGFGTPVPFYAALRFTTTSQFTLTGLRMAYRTELSTNPFSIYIFDASGGNANPVGGNLLVQGTVNAPSQNGRFALFTLNEPPPPFPAGASFFVIVGFANVPFPMGTDDSGTGNYQGRSFFSGTGAAGEWTQLGDILGDGQPDVWKIRALGTGGGGQNAQIAVNPTTLSTTLASGASTTLNLTISNPGSGTLSWSAAAGSGVQREEGPHDWAPGGLAATANDDRAAVRATARARGSAPVIVQLAVPFVPEGALGDREASRQREAIAAAQESVLARLAALAPAGVKQFETVPYLALVADESVLDALEADPAVVAIQEDRWDELHLAESIAIIGAQGAWNQGLTGSGQTVAVLDSGFQMNHPFFGGRGVAEACFSSSFPNQAVSLCPNGQTQQVGAGAAAACPPTVVGCDHGTHVAGAAMGQGQSFSGVARAASLIAVQVFTGVIDPEICGGQQETPCLRTLTSDQILGLEYVYSLRNTHQIASANMSLGGGQEAGHCDGDARKAIIDNLRSARIATVVSSGNEGFTSAMGSPACISSAVAVGSTQDGSSGTVVDAVSPFSNSSAALDFLAPGQVITSSVPGSGFGNMSGTSMAAPHVAGALAVLRQQRPQASVTELLNTLAATGVPITDPRNGITRPRIQLDAAVGGGSGVWLSVNPTSGSTPAGGSSNLAVTIDATGLAAGTHTAAIIITSNATNHPTVTVPVVLTVSGGPPPPAGILTHVPAGATQNTYTTTVGGFVHGTNGYQDQAKAVAFTLPGGASSGQLSGVNVYFSRRAATPVLQNYHVRVYNGTAASGPQGSPVASQMHVLTAATAGEPASATTHEFATPVPVGSTFFVSIDYPGSYGVEDFNIAATAPIGSGSPHEWEMWDDGSWHNMSQAWHSGNDGWHMWVEAVMGGAVSDEPEASASGFALHAGYPNPAAPTTRLRYTLAEAATVRLEVYDALGRRVAVLEDAPRPAGDHEVVWDASGVAGGVYFYRLTAGPHAATRSVLVLR
jgi:subtilisin